MEDPLWKIWEVAGGFGLAVGCLVLGVRWLGKDRDKLVNELHDERLNRIQALESASDQCQKDRTLLHQQIVELHNEVREIYRNHIEGQRELVELAVSAAEEKAGEEEGA